MAGFLGTIAGQVRLDIRQAVAAYATLRAENARTIYALRGTGDAFIKSGRTMATTGGILVYAFGKAVSAAAEFERKMDFFGAITDTTGDKLAQLSKFTLQLAQDTIYTADQVVEAFTELGKAGVGAEAIMDGVGKAVTSLGAATDIPLVNSAQIIVSTMAQFSIGAEKASKVADRLAGAANASLADIEDIGVALKYVGGVAKTSGLNLEDVSTALGILANRGIRGSTAGTSLRQMLVSLAGATGPAVKKMEELGLITKDGTNLFYDQQGSLKPLSKVYQILQNHTKDLSDQQKVLAFRAIFNNRALSAAAILTKAGAAGFRKMNAEIKKTDAGEIAHKRLDNLSGDIEILKGNIETMLTEAGSPFQEMLRGWVQNLTDLVRAFSDLDPGTQKAIVQFIGLAGSALVVMGIINIIVGTVFKFIESMIRLGAAFSFVGGIIGAVGTALGYLFGGLLAGTVAATVALIVILVALLAGAFFLAYKKIKVFRDFVDGLASWFNSNVVQPIWTGIKAIGNAFKTLVTDPQRAWEAIKKGSAVAAQAILNTFRKIPGWIAQGLNGAIKAIASFVSLTLKFFASLPGRIGSLIGRLMAFLGKVFTMKNIGKAVGLGIRLIIARFILLPLKLAELALRAVTAVLKVFGTIGPRVGYAIGFMIGLVIRLWIQWMTRLITLTAQLVGSIVNFFRTLPARLGAIAASMTSRFIAGVGRLLGWARSTGPQIAASLLSGIINLPGRVAGLIGRVISTVVRAGPRMLSAAIDMGLQFFSGLYNTISDLPGVVKDILGKVIDAFKKLITQGFNAAKNFAGGVWKGFKKGLGINSPSYVEKAMFQMNDTVKKETRQLRRNTIRVQDISRKAADTQFSMGTTGRVLNVLNSTQAIQKKAAAASASAPRSTSQGPTPKQLAPAGVGGSRIVAGSLKIDESGTAFITGLAEDVTDSNDNHNAESSRRNREE